MQHHLSQVEERMVLLEAENRNLKGKKHIFSPLYAKKKESDINPFLIRLMEWGKRSER